MPETNTAKPVEKIQDTAREYVREAESTIRGTAKSYNDVIKSTTAFYFDAWDKNVRYGMDYYRQVTEMWGSVLTTYRRMYADNFKLVENYWDEVYKEIPAIPMFPRPK